MGKNICICKNCGKEFESYEPNSKFCSIECYNNKRFSEKVQVQCAECGKIEFVSPSRYKKYKCCSVECLGKYNSKKYNKQVLLKCPICGKEYRCKQSKIEHHRTCGDSNCRTQWLRQTRKGKNNSNYRRVEIELMNIINICKESVRFADKQIQLVG